MFKKIELFLIFHILIMFTKLIHVCISFLFPWYESLLFFFSLPFFSSVYFVSLAVKSVWKAIGANNAPVSKLTAWQSKFMQLIFFCWPLTGCERESSGRWKNVRNVKKRRMRAKAIQMENCRLKMQLIMNHLLCGKCKLKPWQLLLQASEAMITALLPLLL